MTPFSYPASGSAARAMCGADNVVSSAGSTSAMTELKALIRLRIYNTCSAYGTVTQHVVSTTYTTGELARAAEG